MNYRGMFPRLISLIKYRNILLIDTTGIFRKNIYLNGCIVGYQNPVYGNLMIDWQKLKKHRTI